MNTQKLTDRQLLFFCALPPYTYLLYKGDFPDVVTKRDSDGNVWETYTLEGNVVTTRYPNGDVRWTYTLEGNVVTTRYPNGDVWGIYTLEGNVVTERDSDGGVRGTYTLEDNVVTERYSDGDVRYTYTFEVQSSLQLNTVKVLHDKLGFPKAKSAKLFGVCVQKYNQFLTGEVQPTILQKSKAWQELKKMDLIGLDNIKNMLNTL